MRRARLIRAALLTRGRAVEYGAERSQRGDLHVPAGPGPHPLMILVHGGSWQARYGRSVMRGLVGDLLGRGWAAWNIEYRRIGDGGGWPATFLDVAAAIDHVPALRAPLDLDRVSLLGHSAGGQLALWAAARRLLPAGAPGHAAGEPLVRLRRVIAQAGVCDLAGSYRSRGGATGMLMGGGPDDVPERYAVADPLCLLPASAPVLLVHGTADETVSVELSRSYAQAARACGAEVELVEIAGTAGSHRAHIDPYGLAWAAVTSRLAAADPVASLS
jgi:acetyl esterase/lipase